MSNLWQLQQLDESIPVYELYELAQHYGDLGYNVEFGTGRGISTAAIAQGLNSKLLFTYHVKERPSAKKMMERFHIRNVRFIKSGVLKVCKMFDPFTIGFCFVNLTRDPEYLRKVLEKLRFKMHVLGALCVFGTKQSNIAKVIRDFLNVDKHFYAVELNIHKGLSIVKFKRRFADIGVSEYRK